MVVVGEIRRGQRQQKPLKKKEKSGDSFAHRHIGGSCVTHRCAWAAVVFHFCFSHPFIRRTATRFQTCDATTRQLQLITKTPTWTAPCWPFLSSFYWHQVRPPFGFRTLVTKRASNTNCEKRRRERERERKKVLKIPSWIDWCHTAASRDIGVGQFVTDVCKCPIEPGAGMVSWSGARRRRRVYNFFWLMRDLVVGSLRKISRQQQWSNLDREVGERETVVKDQLTLATPLQKLGTGRVLLLLDFLSDERIIESFLEPPFR